MIKGLGIDVVDIKKFRKLAGADSFLKRIFSEKELEYCRGKKDGILNLAGRFAVKEAFIKAVAIDKRIRLRDIETINNSKGKPEVSKTPGVTKLLVRKKARKIHISITHTDNTAAAVCIIE